MYDMYDLVDLLVEMWESPWMVELSRNSFKLSIMICLPMVNIKIWYKESTQLRKRFIKRKKLRHLKCLDGVF